MYHKAKKIDNKLYAKFNRIEFGFSHFSAISREK